MKTYSKIVTFGSPNHRVLTVPHLDIASSEAGREEQMVAAREMVGTGTCTDARVICSEVRADVVRANICDYPLCGCHLMEGVES